LTSDVKLHALESYSDRNLQQRGNVSLGVQNHTAFFPKLLALSTCTALCNIHYKNARMLSCRYLSGQYALLPQAVNVTFPFTQRKQGTQTHSGYLSNCCRCAVSLPSELCWKHLPSQQEGGAVGTKLSPEGRQEIDELYACASMSARQQQTDIAGRLEQQLHTVQACWVMLASSL